MFYLGSIAGILPYILAFSLTLVLGGHAGIPFLSLESKPEIKNEISEEKSLPVENIKSFTFDKQIVNEKITVFLVPFCTATKVFDHYSVRLFDSSGYGISLLRAPPIPLF
jgi:hypothetical protein